MFQSCDDNVREGDHAEEVLVERGRREDGRGEDSSEIPEGRDDERAKHYQGLDGEYVQT